MKVHSRSEPPNVNSWCVAIVVLGPFKGILSLWFASATNSAKIDGLAGVGALPHCF